MLQKEKVHVLWALGILVVFPLLVYWQVGFMVYTLKWDAMDQFFQHQLFMCECFEAGELPLWNPYQYFGSPFYADPQGGFWYPLYWLNSIFSPCDARIINASFMLHVIVGGIGMYKLLKGFGFHSAVVIAFALAYECNGLFVSNAQHMAYVVVGAWLPFVFHYFLQLLRQPKARNAVALGGVAAMLLNGGYPAFAIIIAYLLVALWLVEAVGLFRKNEKKQLFGLTMYSVLAVVVAGLLSLGFIYSFAEAHPLTVRSAELTMKQILFGPYSAKSLVSSVLPYAVSADTARYGSDTSMINGYMGLLTAVFFLPGLFWARFKYKGFFVAMAILSLAAAVGDALPVRELLANVLPGLDKFRFPSIFRAYWIIGAMVIGAAGLHHFIKLATETHPPLMAKRVIMALVVGLTALIGLAVVYDGTFAFPPLFNMAQYPEHYKNAHFTSLVVSQGVLAIAFLVLLYIILQQRKFPISGLLIVWVMAELLVNTQLNVPATIISHRKMERYLAQENKLPRGFPMPTNRPLNSGFESDADLWPTYYNLNTLHKVVGNIGFNPFQLKSAYELNESDCINTVLANPLAFFENGNGTITWKEWKPDNMWLTVESSTGGLVVISQAAYKGWKATIIDERPIDAVVEPFCDALLSVNVPPGVHKVNLWLEKPKVRFLFKFSVIAFCWWAIAMILPWERKPKFQ